MTHWMTLLTNWRVAQGESACRRAEKRLLAEVRRAAVKGALREHGLSRDAADDVAQEVCLRVWRGLRELRADVAFASWLHEVVHNVVCSASRHERSQRRRVEAAQNQSQWHVLWPEKRIEARETLERVMVARNTMSAALANVFDLHLVDGESLADTATALGVARPVVDTRLRRVRIALRCEVFAAA